MDIDGATDIGAAIVDADLFIIDDGAGGTNRKTAASRIVTYVGANAAASQAEMEAASSNTVFATPGRTHNHPGVAKFFVRFTPAVAVPESYNVDGVDDDGTGNWTIHITNAFSSADNYSVVAMAKSGDSTTAGIIIHSPNDVYTADECIVYGVDDAGALRDQTGSGSVGVMAVGFGDQ